MGLGYIIKKVLFGPENVTCTPFKTLKDLNFHVLAKYWAQNKGKSVHLIIKGQRGLCRGLHFNTPCINLAIGA